MSDDVQSVLIHSYSKRRKLCAYGTGSQHRRMSDGVQSVLKKPSKLNLPPSPPRLPLLGNLHQLRPIPHRSAQSLARKHGDVMLLYLGRDPTVVVSSADMAREVLQTQGAAFASRPPLSTISRLLYNYGGFSFSPYGDYWRNTRRICADHLLSARKVRSFRPLREEEVSLLVERIRASFSGGPVNLSDMLVNLTICLISRITLGRKYEDDGNRFRDMMVDIVALLRMFPFRDFIPLLGWMDTLTGFNARVSDTAARVDSFLEAALDEHVRAKRYERSADDQKESMDLVDVLLSLKDDTLKRANIKALVLDMFFGGSHTTFRTLESMMAELVANPEVMKKVQEEIRRVAGSKGMVTEEDCDKMNYFNAVIKETLRMHPAIPFSVHRETTQDVQVRGYDIPKGTRVIINIWGIGRDPRTWERPDEFWPERFVGNDTVDFRGQHFQYIPFGAGKRVCPGIVPALANLKLIMGNLLLNFDWRMPDGMKGEVRQLSETLGSSQHNKSSLILVVKPRSQ